MKLWHDDIRTPPDDSWIWCRTNTELLNWLEDIKDAGQEVTALSLDHDMGLDQLDPDTPEARLLAGRSTEDGTKLVRELTGPVYTDVWEWLVECNPSVTIHSWNTYAALRMHSTLRQRGLRRVYIQRFTPHN